MADLNDLSALMRSARQGDDEAYRRLLGAVTAGAVGEAFGLQAAFAIGAAIVLLGVLGRFVITDDRIRAAESAADAPEGPSGDQ